MSPQPHPYYSLYGGNHAQIRPYFGWNQQAATAIPSTAAIEVPYSYFFEGILAFIFPKWWIELQIVTLIL